MPTLRAVAIVTGFVIFTLPLMLLQWLLLKLNPSWARSFPNWYHRRLAQLFGLHLKIIGTPVKGEGVPMPGE